MTHSFVHLHLHTEYSLVDGLLRVKSLPEEAKSRGMQAIAITDHCNLFAMVKFYRAAVSAGVKPIIGSELWVQDETGEPFRLVALCQNDTGYHNLTELISKSYLEGQASGVPVVQRAWLGEFHDGLIILSGAREGDVGQAIVMNDLARAETLLRNWQSLLGNRFYIELQRTERRNEAMYNEHAITLASKCHAAVVATHDVRFLNEDDFDAHEARVCIHDGYTLNDPKRPRHYSPQQYLKSEDEMVELFSDIPEALKNSVEIAKRCNLKLTFGENYLPNFPVPEGMTIEEYFKHEAQEGLKERLKAVTLSRKGDADINEEATPPRHCEGAEGVRSNPENNITGSRPALQARGRNDIKAYEDRLALELEVINKMGFPGYFLIVADFIRWARENGIPVGPGRGSGAGSLVAYALKITDLDPIEYDLLFERFLNPERVSMPDFDIDFCMEGRDRVIEYVAEKYGRESVSQIITYGTMAARAVVRDVGRVLNHPYGFVDTIAKLIPMELGMTLKNALRQEDQLLERYRNEEEVTALIDLALKLEGTPRNAGKHAGGVVIAPKKLTAFTPLYCEPSGESLVTQFDKDDVETIGLVKFDFLGLRTLTIIDWALKTINAKREKEGEEKVDITTIPLADEKTFELLKACDTTAVFQLESRGMKDLIKRLQPDCFDEIVALVALFRPGPLQSGMVDDFISRKHGRQQVRYPHVMLAPILQSTYGVILYQEQVMKIAQDLAGYTLGGADLLRRAMGKKKPEEMAKHRAIFVAGAEKNKVDAHIANGIYDLIEKFAGYGFNKSHSAAYALLSYQTAWLKTHYPSEFMAAVLSSDMDNTDKVVHFVNDCEKLKLKIIPPDINLSDYIFTVNESNEIAYGLGAIKGVGQAAVEDIVEERRKNGSYSDLYEFCRRLETRKVNRKVLEALVRSGALDSFDVHRASMMVTIDSALTAAEQHERDAQRGQADLFSDTDIHETVKYEYLKTNEWAKEIILQGEKETLGFYLSGHPLDKYHAELMHLVSHSIKDAEPSDEKNTRIAGFISSLRTVMNKRGQRMAFLTLDDGSGRMDVAVFGDAYQTHRDIIIKDQLLVIEGKVSVDDYTGGYKMVADEIYTMIQARERFSRHLLLNISHDQLNKKTLDDLMGLLQPYQGGDCGVRVGYDGKAARAQLSLGEEWCVKPMDELLYLLRERLGSEAVEVRY